MSEVYTADEVSTHNTRDDLWIIYNGKVYDCTAYLDEHPGGEEVILDCAGADATEPFDDIGHSEDAHEILSGLLIGELKGAPKAKIATTTTDSSASNLPLIAGAVVAIAAIAYFLINK